MTRMTSPHAADWLFRRSELLTCPGSAVDRSAGTLSDISGTLGENGQPGGCVVGAHGEMELRVVGILVILHVYAVVNDDVGDWAAVDCKQQRAKHSALRDAHVDTALCPPIQVLLPLSVSELELLCNRVVQSQALEGHDTLGNTPFQISIAPGTVRAPADGSSTLGGSTSVCGRVRSSHTSDGRPWLSCRQPACL